MLMRSIVGRPRRLTTTLALAITLLLYAGAPGVGAAPFVATVLVTGHGILDRGEFAVSGTLFRDSKADGLWGHFMTVKGNLGEPKYVVCLYDDEFVLLVPPPPPVNAIRFQTSGYCYEDGASYKSVAQFLIVDNGSGTPPDTVDVNLLMGYQGNSIPGGPLEAGDFHV